MIDVIVPVYRGLDTTRRCLESVLRSCERTPFELVVVDDATPEPCVAQFLDGKARSGMITLVRNDVNRGFAASVNRGMSLHGDRDVVLLNSDTEVANDWLRRLCAAAARDPCVATVTPFSNNATICTYPFDGWTRGMPGELGLAALDSLVATTNPGATVDLPTAVGFCMYIRRECLRQVGLFDATRFGRGYGEENDFCLRATAVGWLHVLAADVFVYHEGAVSFAERRATLSEKATEAMQEVHPGYVELVRTFVERDPIAAYRSAIDLARAGQGQAELRHVLGERVMERRKVVANLIAAQRLADERAQRIDEATRALRHAEELVAARDAELRDVLAEVGRLRAGLAHAEALAHGRGAVLERIRRTWVGRWIAHRNRAEV